MDAHNYPYGRGNVPFKKRDHTDEKYRADLERARQGVDELL